MTADLLMLIGINPGLLFPGLFGGVVIASMTFQRSGPLRAALAVLSAALTANYLAEPAGQVLGFMNNGPAAFIVGLCAGPITQAIVAAAQKWTPTVPNGGK